MKITIEWGQKNPPYAGKEKILTATISDDADGPDLISAIAGLLISMTYHPTTIANAMTDWSEDILRERKEEVSIDYLLKDAKEEKEPESEVAKNLKNLSNANSYADSKEKDNLPF